jgi:hypothetical protein
MTGVPLPAMEPLHDRPLPEIVKGATWQLKACGKTSVSAPLARVEWVSQNQVGLKAIGGWRGYGFDQRGERCMRKTTLYREWEPKP